MNRRQKTLLVVCAISAVALPVGVRFATRPPSDEEMKTLFFDHRAAFEELADMAQADAPVAVRADGTSRGPSPLRNPSRLAAYRSRMSMLGVEFISASDTDQVMWTYATGIAGGMRVGLLRSAAPPCCIGASFGDAQRKHPSTRDAYVPVADNWYVVMLF